MRFWKPRAKRLAALVCALALTASLLPTAVFADTGDTVSVASSTVTAEEKTKETPAPDATEEGQNTLSVPGEQPKEQPSPEPSESPAPSGEPTPSASPEVTAEPTESPAPSAAPTESPEPAGTPTPTPSASPEGTPEPSESPEPVETPTTTPVLNEVQTFTANAAPDATRNAPEAKADSGKVYSYTGASTAENIYVGFEPAEGPGLDKNITIKVKVDGVQVASKTFNDVYAIGSYLTIDAEMYDLSIDDGGASVTSAGENKWLVTVGFKKDWTITVDLQARTTYGDYEIDEYGTFHWSKQHAANPNFERTLYVYVNGSETPAYTATVKTAETMSNGSSSKQYWFTPNTEKYKADYTINPAITVDAVRKDISVYLTTKCACGNEKCLCPGGCTCPSGCDCDYCTGATLENNQIDTGYGLITYQEPGAMGGYNLTVKVYVNGQEKFVSDQFRVSMGLSGNLKFEVADGYYYHQPNGYDLDTKNDGSTWLIETSQLSIVGALRADREYDNVLSIYLWTFENYVSLDVQRMAGTRSEDITGYQISYTLDDGVTYTYPATAIHDAAQPQTIPTGVDVTISAICPSPKIATVWECAQANATNIFLEGCAGSNNQTKAYGNSATLQVHSVNDPRVVVYVGGVQDVEKPDDTTVNTVSGESAVEVACAAKPSEHEQKTYALESGSYTLAEAISGSAVQGYTYDVTVTGAPYVGKYNDTYEDHTLSTAETDTMVLAYVQTYDADQDVVAGEWQLKEAAEFGVTCDDEPEEPELPDEIDIKNLGNVVIIDCVNEEANHDDIEVTVFGEYGKDYFVEYVNGKTDAATITIVNTQQYADVMTQATQKEHERADSTDLTIDLTYDAATGWTTTDTATIKVKCETTEPEVPGKPTGPQINALLDVALTCDTNEKHTSTWRDLLDGSYTVTEPVTHKENTYECTVTVKADKYVTDLETYHGAHQAGEPASKSVLLVYDNDAWIVANQADATVTFHTACAAPEAPDTDVVAKLLDKVNVVCDVHGEETYAVDPATVEVDKDTLSYIDTYGGFTVKVTVPAQGYVDQYSAAHGEHALDDTATKTIELLYDSGTWFLPETDPSFITFNVKCVTPDAPGFDTVQGLLGGVKLVCGVHDVTENYALTKERVVIDDVVGGGNGATVKVTVLGNGYLSDYNEQNSATIGEHTFAGSQTLTVELVYNNGYWKVAEKDADLAGNLVFALQCVAPDAPTDDDIADALAAMQVQVKCGSEMKHGAGTYTLKSGTYGEPQLFAGDDTWHYTLQIMVEADAYLIDYNNDTALSLGYTHTLGNVKARMVEITFTYDPANKAWNNDAETVSPVVFPVSCHATTPGGEDEPSGGDDGNNDNNNNNNNNNNNTNNNQNKSTASASASASATVTAPAAPAAAVIPQTGDEMPVGLLAGLALVAAGGLAALLVLRKRRSDR